MGKTKKVIVFTIIDKLLILKEYRESSEDCLFPWSQGDIFKLLCLSQQSKTVNNDVTERHSANPHIREAGTKVQLAFFIIFFAWKMS